jgi:pimeloyl-ACP methyl ester carboxylesterase
MSIWDVANDIGDAFAENVTQPVSDVANDIGDAFDENVTQPVSDVANDIGDALDENVIQPLIGNIGDLVAEALPEMSSDFTVISWNNDKNSLGVQPSSNAEIDPNQKTYILIHGWHDAGINSQQNWIGNATQDLENIDPNANILSIDWSAGASSDLFFPSANVTDEVGAGVARYLASYPDLFKPENISLIGWSLGAHVAGSVGQTYKDITGNVIDLIGGLDPAGPGFGDNDTLLDPLILGGASIASVLTGPLATISLSAAIGLLNNRGDALDPDDARRVVVLHSSNQAGHNSNLGDLDIFLDPSYADAPLSDQDGLINDHYHATDVFLQLLDGSPSQLGFPQANGAFIDLGYLLDNSIVGSYSMTTYS